VIGRGKAQTYAKEEPAGRGKFGGGRLKAHLVIRRRRKRKGRSQRSQPLGRKGIRLLLRIEKIKGRGRCKKVPKGGRSLPYVRGFLHAKKKGKGNQVRGDIEERFWQKESELRKKGGSPGEGGGKEADK